MKKTIEQYFKILLLDSDVQVSVEDIENNYRKLAKIYHPDTSIGVYKDGKKFIEIQNARDFLIKNIEKINKMISSNQFGKDNLNYESNNNFLTFKSKNIKEKTLYLEEFNQIDKLKKNKYINAEKANMLIEQNISNFIKSFAKKINVAKINKKLLWLSLMFFIFFVVFSFVLPITKPVDRLTIVNGRPEYVTFFDTLFSFNKDYFVSFFWPGVFCFFALPIYYIVLFFCKNISKRILIYTSVLTSLFLLTFIIGGFLYAAENEYNFNLFFLLLSALLLLISYMLTIKKSKIHKVIYDHISPEDFGYLRHDLKLLFEKSIIDSTQYNMLKEFFDTLL